MSIKTVLTNDSVRLGAETSLLYTDIIVQLEDGSLANVEIQKIGYAFPGERCACYSADHLLRQYKRVRETSGSIFTYRSIKQVYTIILIEKSTSEFHRFPEQWIHRFKQQSNTGLKLELLQEYYFIPLDIYKKSMENKNIEAGLEAWLAFLSYDDPARIEELMMRFPEFRDMYQDIYELCLNTEKVMQMYSKELQILDENTVRYMMDELQAELDQKKKCLLEAEERVREIEERVREIEERVREAEERESENKRCAEDRVHRLEAQIRMAGLKPVE